MASTLEFWKDGDQIYVEFNLVKYAMPEFLRLEEASMLIDRMYGEIILNYKKDVDLDQPKLTVVAQFIMKYFLDKDRTFDVVILGNGDVVKFNLEKED